MNQFRTFTVVALCESMRQTQDYSACPILADALQDAECTDENLLTNLRASELSFLSAQQLVALVYSDDTSASIRYVCDLAKELGGKQFYDEEDSPKEMTYAELMTAAKEWIDTGDHYYMGTNENYKDHNWDEFWEHYEVITGVFPQGDRYGDRRHGFFSCSC